MNPLLLLGVAGAALAFFAGRKSTPSTPAPAPGGAPPAPVPSPPTFTAQPVPDRPAPAGPKTYLLSGGLHYNFTQRVFDVPDTLEAKRVVDSLRSRGHFNVIAKIEPSQNSWLVNYDSFEMPADGVVKQGQRSQLGPYASELLEVRDVGDLPALFA